MEVEIRLSVLLGHSGRGWIPHGWQLGKQVRYVGNKRVGPGTGRKVKLYKGGGNSKKGQGRRK